MLAECTGLAAHVEYREGDALAVPFADETFDVVWSQNVAMNIADRDRLYREIRRVLVPGGRYAFADIVAGNSGPPHYPLPWAQEPSGSFLLTADATRTALAAAGFRMDVFEDQTTDAIAQQKARTQTAAKQSMLGVHIILGADGLTILRNSVQNFEEGRIGLVQGVATSVT
jgi:SAM-dependent methyltransferase